MAIALPNEIIQSDKTPRTAIAFDKTSGIAQTPDTARIVLLVGPQGNGATVAALTPTQLLRATDGATYAGSKSMIDFACQVAFAENDEVLLYYVGIADTGTVKAAATVTFAGNATATTIYRLRIAFTEVDFNVTVGDTPTVQAANLAAAVNAANVPVTATSAAGVTTLTATVGGTVGNGIQLRGAFDVNVATVTTTATLSGASLASGTGAVSTSAALAAATGLRFHIVACLLDDLVSAQAARDHATSESDAEHDHGCIAVQALVGTLTANTTQALAVNGPRNVQGAINGTETWGPLVTAAQASVMSMKEAPARPYNGMVLTTVAPPPISMRWARTDTRTMYDNGVTPLVVIPGEQVAIQRAVSTGVTNTQGAPDYSTLDITKFEAFDYIRDAVTLMFDTNYGDSEWADSDPDGLLPNDVATPAKVTVDLYNVLKDCESDGVIQNVDALKSQIVVQKVDDMCQFSLPAAIVDGMHRKLGKIVYINRPLSAQGS